MKNLGYGSSNDISSKIKELVFKEDEFSGLRPQNLNGPSSIKLISGSISNRGMLNIYIDLAKEKIKK